jgi:hypothetical protein
VAEKTRMRRVFVPGGLPEYTYVRRERIGLEKQLAAAADNLCKLVTLTGPTKSGKSVVTKKVFPTGENVWLDGGSVSNDEDLWLQIVDQLDGATEVGESKARSTGGEVGGGASGEAGLPLLAKAQAEVTAKVEHSRSTEKTSARRLAPKAAALDLLRKSGRPLIIDDFHYLDREMQGSVVRALKALVHDGHPAILLAIPHRKYDAVRVEKEMTARVQQVSMPAWNDDELREIAHLGFPLLNLAVNPKIIDLFLAQALGSPHLMQEFCRQLCDENGVEERCDELTTIEFAVGADAMFERVARDTSKTIFDRLARGPRPRTDRNQRSFKDGGSGDIYVAVLLSIARLRPGMTTLEYEEIRASLRDVVDELPQAHEVSRVLEHMAAIQADDAASAPVLDWDKDERRLHITDPFFAFFLRWGMRDFRSKEAGS